MMVIDAISFVIESQTASLHQVSRPVSLPRAIASIAACTSRQSPGWRRRQGKGVL
jgi:hypothetical protein